MSANPYVLRIEEDPQLSEGFWLVAIYRLDDSRKQELIGIPMRGVRREAAKEALRHLRFAFEYGLTAARHDVAHALHRLPCHAVEGI